MKRSHQQIEEDGEGSEYLKIKQSKSTIIYYMITNIISTSRIKLVELFQGDKFYEMIPYHLFMSKDKLEDIKMLYGKLFDCYETVKDKETFLKFEDTYQQCINCILEGFPKGEERDILEVTEVSIPMPFGLFYTAVTQLKESYNFDKISYDEYASCRDYSLRNKDNDYALIKPHLQCILYEDVVSPSDKRYNDLDVKYLDVIPTFCTVYGWLTDKCVSKTTAGLSLDVDRFKLYVRMGEMLGPAYYFKEDMLQLK